MNNLQAETFVMQHLNNNLPQPKYSTRFLIYEL